MKSLCKLRKVQRREAPSREKLGRYIGTLNLLTYIIRCKVAILLQIIENFSHPKYEANKVYYDIALLKLERQIKFTDYRRPACLYRKQVLPAKMVATGWGKTGNGTFSKDLLKVNLTEVPIDECKKYYNSVESPSLPDGLNPKHMFCAGGGNTGADTCEVIERGGRCLLLSLIYVV